MQQVVELILKNFRGLCGIVYWYGLARLHASNLSLYCQRTGSWALSSIWIRHSRAPLVSPQMRMMHAAFASGGAAGRHATWRSRIYLLQRMFLRPPASSA